MVATIGEIRAFSFNYAPQGWVECDGKAYSRADSKYGVLFEKIGTIYGGDGNPNFNVPDLRGRVLMGAGKGFGLIERQVGEKPGEDMVKLTLDDLPSHTHVARAYRPVGSTGLRGTPQAGDHLSRLFGDATHFGSAYCTKRLFPVQLNEAMVGVGGGGLGHENRQPFLPVTYCIAIYGIR